MAGASEVRLVTHIVSPSLRRCKGACVDERRKTIFDQHREWQRKKVEREAELEHARKLAEIQTKSEPLPSHQEPIREIPSGMNLRQAFVLPLLEQRGWSVFEWANEASVDHATAIDYLRNIRKPYPSTRVKLANALGITPDQLPK